MKSTFLVTILSIIIINKPLKTLQKCISKQTSSEDAKLNFTELGRKYGQEVTEHDVTTEDGYILKLFNVRGNKSRPVLLMHGLSDNADTFILRGRKSLSVTLAESGYDVWVGNSRGVSHSRRHATLNPDVHSAFWDFSFHESGFYDLPALIDYILDKTSSKKISAVGHSQGNTIFYVLGSTRPEYNDKVNVLVALGPSCYLNNIRPPLSVVLPLAPVINTILKLLQLEELLPEHSIYRQILYRICSNKHVGYDICGGVFFAITGFDEEEFEEEMFYIVIEHAPSSVSRKNLEHLAQIANRKTFSYFDYGEHNYRRYNMSRPPKYDLGKVTMKVAMFIGKNDNMTPIKDVDHLRRSLPNVVEFKVMGRETFNHMDHVWGRNMDKYLFPDVLRVLSKYCF